MTSDRRIIWIAAAENKVTKIINSYGKKATYHNGGFRVGISIESEEDEDFVAVTKKASYAALAESWGVLKAVEHAISQGWRRLECKTVGHCTSDRRMGGFFIRMALAKAMVADMELEITSSGKDGHPAVELARSQDAPFLPRLPDPDEETQAAIRAAMKSLETDGGETNPVEDAQPAELPTPSGQPNAALLDA